jgi:hypothetical protein
MHGMVRVVRPDSNRPAGRAAEIPSGGHRRLTGPPPQELRAESASLETCVGP